MDNEHKSPPSVYKEAGVVLQNITLGENKLIIWEKFILLKNYYFKSLKASKE